MSKPKEINLFPGSNTSKGFYSFYRYILTQDNANRILCLKGGPGTGKSSLMKKVGKYFFDKGYNIEYHHCSSDSNSLDGIVVKELNVAILDGTSPHIVDPITPGAVDEIINLGDALDIDKLTPHKKEIIALNREISKNFKRAYRFLGSAKYIHDDWSNINYESLDSTKISNFIQNLKNNIFKRDKSGYGDERHLFSTAITPSGITTYTENIVEDYKTKYVLIGGPGYGKTEILKYIGSCGQKKGYYIEYMHDPFIPERIEHLLIPELNTCILTNNEISKCNFSQIDYNLSDYSKYAITGDKLSEIEYNSKLFYNLIAKSVKLIDKAHTLHDKLETYYISAMDFSIVDKIYDSVIKKLEKYYV